MSELENHGDRNTGSTEQTEPMNLAQPDLYDNFQATLDWAQNAYNNVTQSQAFQDMINGFTISSDKTTGDQKKVLPGGNVLTRPEELPGPTDQMPKPNPELHPHGDKTKPAPPKPGEIPIPGCAGFGLPEPTRDPRELTKPTNGSKSLEPKPSLPRPDAGQDQPPTARSNYNGEVRSKVLDPRFNKQ